MNVRRSLTERLSTQRALIGLLLTQPIAAFAEVAAICGADFLVLDDEHGIFSASDHLQIIQVLGHCNTSVFVRVRGADDTQAIGRYLDMGVDGIVVPGVSSAAQVRTLVRAMEYPPLGARGVGAALHRVTRYGLDTEMYQKAPRAGAALIIIIESAVGVANANEILSVDGVDAVLVGPSDLAADLGCIGDFADQRYGQALGEIERAALSLGKILGTGPHRGYPIEALLERGHRLFIVGADLPLIREAVKSTLAKAKSCL